MIGSAPGIKTANQSLSAVTVAEYVIASAIRRRGAQTRRFAVKQGSDLLQLFHFAANRPLSAPAAG